MAREPCSAPSSIPHDGLHVAQPRNTGMSEDNENKDEDEDVAFQNMESKYRVRISGKQYVRLP